MYKNVSRSLNKTLYSSPLLLCHSFIHVYIEQLILTKLLYNVSCVIIRIQSHNIRIILWHIAVFVYFLFLLWFLCAVLHLRSHVINRSHIMLVCIFLYIFLYIFISIITFIDLLNIRVDLVYYMLCLMYLFSSLRHGIIAREN